MRAGRHRITTCGQSSLNDASKGPGSECVPGGRRWSCAARWRFPSRCRRPRRQTRRRRCLAARWSSAQSPPPPAGTGSGGEADISTVSRPSTSPAAPAQHLHGAIESVPAMEAVERLPVHSCYWLHSRGLPVRTCGLSRSHQPRSLLSALNSGLRFRAGSLQAAVAYSQALLDIMQVGKRLPPTASGWCKHLAPPSLPHCWHACALVQSISLTPCTSSPLPSRTPASPPGDGQAHGKQATHHFLKGQPCQSLPPLPLRLLGAA